MGRFKDKFKPDIFCDDVYTLDIECLKKIGIKAIIFDIDNTLVTYDDLKAPEHTKKWFEMLHQNNILTCLVSNNNKERVENFAKSLNEPYFYAALKPKKKYIIKACDVIGVSPNEAAWVGDQVFTDIYGANRTGIRTIMVRYIHPKEEIQIVLKRKLEKIVLFFYRRYQKRTK